MIKEIIKSVLADVEMEPAVNGSLWDFLSRVSNYALIVSAIFIAPLLYILAVFYLFSAAGNIEKIKRAKNLFFWTTIGLVIILVGRGLFAYLAKIF